MRKTKTSRAEDHFEAQSTLEGRLIPGPVPISSLKQKMGVTEHA